MRESMIEKLISMVKDFGKASLEIHIDERDLYPPEVIGPDMSVRIEAYFVGGINLYVSGENLEDAAKKMIEELRMIEELIKRVRSDDDGN